jgi:hypothetical protein
MRNGPYELVIAPENYPGKKYRGRYVYEHHLVWWKSTGEILTEDYVLHHKDGDKRHNVVDNLEKMHIGEHVAEHNQVPLLGLRCGWCGGTFTLLPSVARSRIRQSSSGKVFCCRSHQVKAQWNGARFIPQ